MPVASCFRFAGNEADQTSATAWGRYRITVREFEDGRVYDVHRQRIPDAQCYREEFAKIDRREKLIDRDDKGNEFLSPESRTYCVKVIENYDMPATTRVGCRSDMAGRRVPRRTR